MTFSVEAGGQLPLTEGAKRLQLTKGVRGMPAVKSVILVIVTVEFSSETQYQTQKHSAVYSIQLVHFSLTILWEALQARQQQSGKKQVTASNSISLHNKKPERRWYPTNGCMLPL